MALLKNYTKQPAERLDYDFDYSKWLVSGDALISAVFTVDILNGGISENPLVIDSEVCMPTFTKAWITGGLAGENYKVSCTATTSRGRTKQDEIKIRIKDY